MDGNNKAAPQKILTLLGLIAGQCITGCNLLGIPSYRMNEASCSPACSAGPLPPLPGCLADWQAQKDLPAAPEYPRFHPLPTRPMFTPQPAEYPHQ